MTEHSAAIQSLSSVAKHQIRKSSSNKVPQVGAIHVVRSVVNLIGASEDAREERQEVKAFSGGP